MIFSHCTPRPNQSPSPYCKWVLEYTIKNPAHSFGRYTFFLLINTQTHTDHRHIWGSLNHSEKHEDNCDEDMWSNCYTVIDDFEPIITEKEARNQVIKITNIRPLIVSKLDKVISPHPNTCIFIYQRKKTNNIFSIVVQCPPCVYVVNCLREGGK